MKYIIEIEDNPCNEPFSESIWRAKNFRTLVFDKVGLSKLTPLDDAGALGDVIKMEREQAYRDGFDNGEQEGYEIAHAECVAKNTRSYSDGFDAGEEELKGIVLGFLRSMVKDQTESKYKTKRKYKPEAEEYSFCDECVHDEKPEWANPCADCKHNHIDHFIRKTE